MKEEAKEEYGPSNQAETMSSTNVNDPHLSTRDGLHIVMPSAGIEHGGEVHYDKVTRSDSNLDR